MNGTPFTDVAAALEESEWRARHEKRDMALTLAADGSFRVVPLTNKIQAIEVIRAPQK